MNRKQRRIESAKSRRLEELKIRYGARTVFAAVIVNTDEKFEDVAERLWEAAQNEKKDMVAVTAHPPSSIEMAMQLWKEQEVEVRYGGRTLTFGVYVNTDEEAGSVLKKILDAACIAENEATRISSKGRLPVVVNGGEIGLADAKAMWEGVIRNMKMRAEEEKRMN